ncbi:MAG: glycosyltransferase family 9 protein [Elusimicrobiota bacterium]|jgi:ADP-heptose:LPS heptosyltransferase|nr:glycosyltransferase family 9 protein [Elusimicrobiota bacterium]
MKKILLITFGNIAQNLAATPAISVLKRNFPKADITVLTDKSYIFANNPYVEETILSQTFSKEFRTIKDAGYDLAVLFNTSFKYSLLLFLAGVKKRLAPSSRLTNLFINNPVKIDEAKTKAEQNISLLSPLFIYSFPSGPMLNVPKKADEEAKKYLSDAGILPSDKFILMCPSGQGDDNWPKDKYAALIDALALKFPTVKILLIGKTKKDISAANEIYWRSIRKPLVAREQLTLEKFTALLNRSALVVSNYKAPSHLASALGKAVIAFIPNDTKKNILKPYGSDTILMEAKEEGQTLADISPSEVADMVAKLAPKFLAKNKDIKNAKGTFSFFNN